MSLQMKYFVLKPAGATPHAEASRQAMRTYAACIRAFDPELAIELRMWANNCLITEVQDESNQPAEQSLADAYLQRGDVYKFGDDVDLGGRADVPGE